VNVPKLRGQKFCRGAPRRAYRPSTWSATLCRTAADASGPRSTISDLPPALHRSRGPPGRVPVAKHGQPPPPRSPSAARPGSAARRVLGAPSTGVPTKYQRKLKRTCPRPEISLGPPAIKEAGSGLSCFAPAPSSSAKPECPWSHKTGPEARTPAPTTSFPNLLGPPALPFPIRRGPSPARWWGVFFFFFPRAAKWIDRPLAQVLKESRLRRRPGGVVARPSRTGPLRTKIKPTPPPGPLTHRGPPAFTFRINCHPVAAPFHISAPKEIGRPPFAAGPQGPPRRPFAPRRANAGTNSPQCRWPPMLPFNVKNAALPLRLWARCPPSRCSGPTPWKNVGT